MKKIFFIILTLFFTVTVNAEEFNINSQNAIVINLNDNSVLYEKNSEKEVYIASLTKILTTIISIEKIDDLKDTVTVTEEMLQGIYEYSKAGLQVGDVVTYEDLLYGVILPSGADAVQALEITLAGNRENFAKLMNDKAKELNLSNSHFSNGIGMDEDNYSTVKDISTLLKYALKNEIFHKIYTTKEYTMTNGLKVVATLETHSLDTSVIKGSKTGFTDASGLCISALYEDDTYNYLVVTANANFTEGKPYHIIDALTIINYYLDNYHYVTLYNESDTITSIPILDSKQTKYDIKTEEIKLFLKKDVDKSNLDLDIKQINSIDKNNKKGDYLGTINIKYNDETLYTKDYTLNDNIEYKKNIDKTLIIFLIIIVILLLIYNLLLRKKIHRLIKKIKGLN